VEKYGTVGEATNDNINTAQAFSMLDNEGYKHTLRIFNAYCFYIATVVTRTRMCYVIRTYIAYLFIYGCTDEVV
jgi:hypothetical protein